MARGAVQQLDAEAVLELADVLADRRPRQPQLPAGLGEAAEFDHFDEGPQAGQLVHEVRSLASIVSKSETDLSPIAWIVSRSEATQYHWRRRLQAGERPCQASITSPPSPVTPLRNFDFYTRTLGLRFVKKTVNFDDPGTYHFYYGDEAGHARHHPDLLPVGAGRARPRRRRPDPADGVPRAGGARSATGRIASSRRALPMRRSKSASASRCWPSPIPTA